MCVRHSKPVYGLILISIGFVMVIWSRFLWTEIRLPEERAEDTVRDQWLKYNFGSRRIGAIAVGLGEAFLLVVGLTEVVGAVFK